MNQSDMIIVGVALIVILVREVVWRLRLRQRSREAARTSVNQSRAVLKGRIGEQVAPLLPGFPFHPADVRFIGGTVDLLVFVGRHTGSIEEVVLADIKTGGARLTGLQKQVMEAVNAGRVRWETIRLE